MKQFLVISGILIFMTGCATTAHQDSSQSQPKEATAALAMPAGEEPGTPAAPKMIEVVVETTPSGGTIPSIETRGSRLLHQTISITPAPNTMSPDSQSFVLVLSEDQSSQKSSARQHEEIVIVPRHISPDALHTPRYVDVSIFNDKDSNAGQGGESFFVVPTP